MAAIRKRWVGGNWKCNGSFELVSTLAKAFDAFKFDGNAMDVVLFPSNLYITKALECFDKQRFKIGVQNFSQAKCGAFTGEIAIPMLNELGLEWTLIGHSERRTLFGETDAIVAQKVNTAQQGKLRAAVCIGENLTERESGRVEAVLTTQLDAFMGMVTDWDIVVIAYEPVWAIGTGKVATCEEVREAHQMIRDYMTSKLGSVAETIRIVYGGSVNEQNCQELLHVPNMDGFLVGGKSITPGFADIMEAAYNVK
ncbi:putative triosephosphate isomerase protein [Babesia bovis T2Bo]|uniref:Triosephosphate isomerase n=1 Tax=Babesia bovis TaxID=5865 RepID=A7AT20_BABBO|nr:putative triosephosphate isomerase protein [Babesia bovis T2Bo]EDO06081.1 putative triosephosphate isomerase protein [Babesia bovis T2Bo]|eukprot:XP_001609649.1 triosephosphate isomerase protein [Babesia bovis T2Bo]